MWESQAGQRERNLVREASLPVQLQAVGASGAVVLAHDFADKYAPMHNPAPTMYSSQVAEMAYG